MKKIISKTVAAILLMTLLASCNEGPNGTYVPKNDAAKHAMYSKFIFKRGRVKIEMGAGGITLPGGYEYAFKREGNKVSIEMRVAGVNMGGIDLNYNDKRDELSLLFGGETGKDLNQYAPVWAKEGSFDPNAPKESQETTAPSSKSFVDKIIDRFRKAPQPSPESTPISEQKKDKKEEQVPQPPLEKIKEEKTEQSVPAPEKKHTLQPSRSSENNGQDNGSQAIPPIPKQPAYTAAQLNDWLNSIAKGDDAARDEMGKLKKVKVNGVANISDVQQLITDVSNGTHYTVTNINADGSITVKKQAAR
ncbi:hypothetical protein FACS1894145_4600 [Bacteroidia bacterium]|nr:hypothetical protein FACS1894145_4600 [Bacteroidia bacterium]